MTPKDPHQPDAKEVDKKLGLKVHPDVDNKTGIDTSVIGTTIAEKYQIQYLIASGGMSKCLKPKAIT